MQESWIPSSRWEKELMSYVSYWRDRFVKGAQVDRTDSKEEFFVALWEMNTPTTRDFLRRPDGTRRRSARQALAVIPVNNAASSPGVFLVVYVLPATFHLLPLVWIHVFQERPLPPKLTRWTTFWTVDMALILGAQHPAPTSWWYRSVDAAPRP